jgi:phosphatidylinositol glycan class M
MTVRVLSNFCEQEEEENNDDNSLAARQRNKRTVRQWFTAAAAGLWHGIAIHVKIYPIIYTLSFAACLSSSLDSTMPRDPAGASSSHNHVTAKRRGIARTTINLLVHWLLRLLSPLPILFGTVTLLTFASLTYASYAMYGFQSLQEGLLYHLSRVDHRHNYSIFWYWIYLSRARAAETAVSLAATATDSFHPPHDGVALASSSFGVLGRLLLLPQAALLLYVSLGVAPKRLNLALFVQTFAFVALNKVVTAQYFTWYLVLLPLCSGEIEWSRPRLQASLAILGWSVAAWLGTAYCLEMLGMAVHRTVFAASILFFAANINLLGALLSAASLPSSSHNDQRVPSRVIGGIKND